MAGRSRPLEGLPGFDLRPMRPEDLDKAVAIEAASYPADEAATPEKLAYRLREAPELFYGAYEGGAELVGFTVGTLAASGELTEESMCVHVPTGHSLCIHSVVITESKRRRGVARAMVRAYVNAIAEDTTRCGHVRCMLLMAKAHLLGFYVQCGFTFRGPSKVVHGADPWYELALDIRRRRQLDFLQVDAFTPVATGGNPAAVLFTQRQGDEEWMQAIAVENNLSETAYLESLPDEEGGGASRWHIRWFTPNGEVDLCGHATLGSAHALWHTGRVPAGRPIEFQTNRAGKLICEPLEGGWIRMDFPSGPPTPLEASSDALVRGAVVKGFGLSEGDLVYLGQGPPTVPDVFLEVTPAAFARMAPDMGLLAQVPLVSRGLIVTCAGAGEGGGAGGGARQPRVLLLGGAAGLDRAFDFSSRMFAPAMGIPEDPVTGSAHTLLGPYWAGKLGKMEGEEMMALQASSRGGVLRVSCRPGGRVYVEGQSVTVIEGLMAV